MIARWSGRIPAGNISERVTGFEDWLPTLMEIAGAMNVSTAQIDGISFAHTLFGKQQESRPFLYREFPAYGGQQSVRMGKWKAVRQGLNAKEPVVRTELYDLEVKGETTDVAAQRPEIVARLEKIMAEQHVKSKLFVLRAIDAAEGRK